jgi:hypothetical protein
MTSPRLSDGICKQYPSASYAKRGIFSGLVQDTFPWHILTGEDIQNLHAASSIMPHIDTRDGKSGITVHNGSSKDYEIPVPGRIRTSCRLPDGSEPDHHSGWEILPLMRLIPTELGTHLSRLLEGQSVRLLWWADAETNGYLESRGLHGDLILLEAASAETIDIMRLASRVTDESSVMRLLKRDRT